MSPLQLVRGSSIEQRDKRVQLLLQAQANVDQMEKNGVAPSVIFWIRAAIAKRLKSIAGDEDC